MLLELYFFIILCLLIIASFLVIFTDKPIQHIQSKCSTNDPEFILNDESTIPQPRVLSLYGSQQHILIPSIYFQKK